MGIERSKRLEGIINPPHGGIYPGELRLRGKGDGRDLLDFSVNSNPYGPPETVSSALLHFARERKGISSYPDPLALLLCERLALQNELDFSMVLAANGSVEIFWLIALAYLDPGDIVLVLGPAFGEYRVASQVAGARVVERQSTEPDHTWQISEMIGLVAEERPKLIWLANPANPTGQYLSSEAIYSLLGAFEGLIILDEAYRNFVSAPWFDPALVHSGRVILVRSMTKDYALAGLRLGYALATPEIISSLKRVQPPWSVSTPGQVAGLAALEDNDFLRLTLPRLTNERDVFIKDLRQIGAEVLPTATHFFLLRSGEATSVRAYFFDQGFVVRDCTSFGLPSCLRLATRLPEENARFVAAYKAFL